MRITSLANINIHPLVQLVQGIYMTPFVWRCCWTSAISRSRQKTRKLNYNPPIDFNKPAGEAQTVIRAFGNKAFSAPWSSRWGRRKAGGGSIPRDWEPSDGGWVDTMSGGMGDAVQGLLSRGWVGFCVSSPLASTPPIAPQLSYGLLTSITRWPARLPHVSIQRVAFEWRRRIWTFLITIISIYWPAWWKILWIFLL